MKVVTIMAYTGLGRLKHYPMRRSRIAAKKTRNFAEADRIRKELIDAGIMLEDSPQGTTWRRE